MNRSPKAPPNLRPEAKRYWKKVNENYILDDDALEVLRSACFAKSREMEAKEVVDREGLTFKCGDSIRQHPCVRIEKEARQQFLKAVKQLGLDVNEEKRLPGRPPAKGGY